MSVNVTISLPLSTYHDLKSGRGVPTECTPEILRALLRGIRSSPCENPRPKPHCPPLAIEAPPQPPITKKVTYTKVTRFRKPDDCSTPPSPPSSPSSPPSQNFCGVLLTVEGSVDSKKYRVDYWTKMSSLRAALSKTNGIDGKDFALYYQGRKVGEGDTPEKLGMSSRDKIQMRKIVRPR